MFNRLAYLLTLLLISGFLFILNPTSALACSTTTVPPDILTTKPDLPENRAETTPIIFEGVVAGYDLIAYRATASVKVYQYLKGIGPGAVYIDGFGNNSGDCRQTLKVGQHAIFYANGDPYSRLSANYYQAYKATDEASLSNIQKIVEVVRQQPIIIDNQATLLTTPTVVFTPQPGPTVAQIVTLTQNSNPEVIGIVWFGVGLVVGGGAIWFVLRRRRG